jgi:hypothetical protein
MKRLSEGTVCLLRVLEGYVQGCFAGIAVFLVIFPVLETDEGDPTWSCSVYLSFVQLFGTCNSFTKSEFKELKSVVPSCWRC